MSSAYVRDRSSDPGPGVVVDGRFRIEGELGRGATSVVYRVRTPDGEPCALKRLTARGRTAELRFRREYQTLVRLAHPRIVAARDYGLDRDAPYYTMELVDGPALDSERPAQIRDACVVLFDVASALAHLHARRLVHRDLSPRNVRLSKHGHAQLLDFGALATVGIACDVTGTPPFVAPEALRRLPLDGRTDIFGLGALAFFVLTGVDAFPAARLDELESRWQTPPPSLLALRPELPRALDLLVGSMLSLDPMGRPVNATEVLDRLAAIAEIDVSEAPESGGEWLERAPLVGRDDQVTELRDAVRDAARGSGRGVVIAAASGLGKTRMLQEAGLEGRLSGATVLSASGDAADRGPFGVLGQLTDDALRVCPDDVLGTARPHARLLAVALPEIARRLGVSAEPDLGDPNEARLRVQQALLAWFEDFSRVRALAILVDDVQRADEASAAFLAALARSAARLRVGLVAALRTDEAVRSPAPIAALSEASLRIQLAPLSRDNLRELVSAWFGDLAGKELIADWLQRFGGGSPLYSAELGRFLRSQGILDKQGRRWSLVGELPEHGLPSALAEALDSRIVALGAHARRLAEVLAIQGGDIPLELAVALYDGNEDDAFAALDELVVEEIIMGSAEAFRFRHDGLREAVLRTLGEQRRRSLHRRAAEMLLRYGARGADHESQIGWHFLRGGEHDAAARHLVAAGRRLYESHSFRDAIAPLRAALEVIEQRGDSAIADTLELRLMLIRAGAVCDRSVLLEYVDETLDVLRTASGLALADRTRRFTGRRVGLVTGVGWRMARRALVPGDRRLPRPADAVVTLISLANFAASARSLAYEIPELRALVAMLEPLTAFRMPRMAHALASNFLSMPLGLWNTVRSQSDWLLGILEHERLPLLAEIDQKMAIGAARYMRAAIAVLEQDPSYAAELYALERLDLRFFDVAANTARLLYHRLRGEEPATERFEREHEMWRVQLGSAWAFDSQIAWMNAIGYGLSGDLLGLKSTADRIEALIGEGYRLEPFAALARGDYLRERGELARSRSVLEAALVALRPEQSLERQLLAPALSDTCLAEHDLDAAIVAAQIGFEVASDAERGMRTGRVRAGRARARALAASGRPDEAAALIDELLTETEPTDSPTLCGMLHEAAAEIHAQLGEHDRALRHRAELERRWRATENPALIARWERSCRTWVAP